MEENQEPVATQQEGTEAEPEATPQDQGNEGAPSQEVVRGKEEIAQDYGTEDEEPKPSKPAVDYEKRYKDSQREYEKKYKPMEESLNFLNELVQEDPELAARIEAAAAAKRQAKANPVNQNQELTQRLERVEKVAEEMTQEQKEKALAERYQILEKFDRSLGKTLSKEQKLQVGKAANALFRDKVFSNYAEALEKAYYLHNPQALVQKGKDEAYVSQFQTSTASFRQQSSENVTQKPKAEDADALTPRSLQILEKMNPKYREEAIKRRTGK